MDADGSHNPKYLNDLMAKIGEHGLVIGSRYVRGGSTPGWELWRRMLSAGGNVYTRFLTGLPIHDSTAGFCAIRKDILDALNLDAVSAAGYAFQIQMKYLMIRHLHASVHEVPIEFLERREGESKLSRHIIWEGIQAPAVILAERFKRLFPFSSL
jgi:dolichol-phosphate mannosyltransferase